MTMHMTSDGAFLRREGPESESATAYPTPMLQLASHHFASAVSGSSASHPEMLFSAFGAGPAGGCLQPTSEVASNPGQTWPNQLDARRTNTHISDCDQTGGELQGAA
jgi:hypothetical protein